MPHDGWNRGLIGKYLIMSSFIFNILGTGKISFTISLGVLSKVVIFLRISDGLQKIYLRVF